MTRYAIDLPSVGGRWVPADGAAAGQAGGLELSERHVVVRHDLGEEPPVSEPPGVRPVDLGRDGRDRLHAVWDALEASAGAGSFT